LAAGSSVLTDHQGYTMCIICNVTIGSDVSAIMHNVEAASAFLNAYEDSRHAMKAAASAMLAVSKIKELDQYPETRKRYDAIHKDMMRQIREWNKLEEKREIGSDTRGV
jgi:transcription elongation factor Elf1